MDVYCAHCGEPWEMAHMRNDAAYDILPDDTREMPTHEFDIWEGRAAEFARAGELNADRRRWMKAAGWQFGESVFVVKRCPCCKDNGPAPEDRQEFIAAIQEFSGHDPDGMASDMEDLA